MKKFLTATAFFTLLILFSCDDDEGTLPDTSQRNIKFAKTEKAFKRFLEILSSRNFSHNGSSYFAQNDQSCGETVVEINYTPYSFTSNPCYYDDNYQTFGLFGSTQVSQKLELFLEVYINSVGIPPTGTYYQNSFMLAALVENGSDLVHFYISEYPVIHVVNNGGNVTASFDEVLFYSNESFFVKGGLTCCN